MSKIRILSEDVSNRIAAGEVIERPASVVKELVENSLDAGATKITIRIARGGHSMVQVIDNGSGMDTEDALLCLEAHATSKIRSANDIEKIASLGFRGEALPSIASVSHLEIRTRPADFEVGFEVFVNGGVIKSTNEAGCPQGTSTTVKHLFYNIPARRKFLRTPKTEESHIQEIVLLAALANPTVGFQLYFDQRSIITVQSNHDSLARATLLLGKETTSSMLPVEYEEEDIKLTGLIARPGWTRSTRREQRAFVNGRPIDSNTIYHAIREAYHTLVMKGRYPTTLLFLTLDPSLMDINVHPAKREVRFHDGRKLGRILATGIRRALRGLSGEGISLNQPAERQPLNNFSSDFPENPMQALLTNRSPMNPIASASFPSTPKIAPQTFNQVENKPISENEMNQDSYPQENIDSRVSPEYIPSGTSISAADKREISRLRILGAISNLFLVAEGREGLVLIDQHAAHERVLFEKILRQVKEKDGIGQGLLLPITIEFSNSDAGILKKNVKKLLKLGFEIENFGGDTFLVTAIPAHFPHENINGMLRDIIDDLRDSPVGSKRVMDEHKIAKAACKAAVKARDQLSPDEITTLLKELCAAELPYTCPHGRPTMINISIKELEKRFGRRQ